MNHIEVFSALTSGKLKTILSGNLPYKDILSIVREVNTKIICENVPLSKVNMHTENFNFQALGYWSHDDFTITTTSGKTSEFSNITVTPVSHYILHDNFTLALAPDKRSKIILGFLADEFERIKCRALYTFESSTNENRVKLYAIKNRQFIKTCFHNHKAIFHDIFTLHPNYLGNPDAYIHYYINFFLIRLRLFYEKLFEDFLGTGKKAEKQLLAELFQINPALMYNQLSTNQPDLENKPVFECSEPVQQPYAAVTSLALAYETIGKAHNISADTLKILVGLIGKFKWNGKKNILGDAIFQLLQKKDENDLPMLEASPDVLATLISLLCIDSTGNSLSKATIRTYLQPCKVDKRPKEGSKLNEMKNK